jgi:uncharacterized protein
MKKKFKRIVVITLGVFFLLLGLAGLVLPILQGWLFIAIGLLLLSMYSPKLRGWIHERTVKYPTLHAFVDKAEAWVVRVFGAPDAD